MELQLQKSNLKISELSDQLAAEQQKLQNTLKDGDVKVKALESQIVSLSSQAQADRYRIDQDYAQREQALRDELSMSDDVIGRLNDTVKSLQVEIKDKDAKLAAAESTLDSIRADAKAVEENLSRSLESAIETKEATENRLSELEKQIAEKDSKLNRMEDEHIDALKELKLLQASVEANDGAHACLESELLLTRKQAIAESEELRSTVAALRKELAAKDVSFKAVVQATNTLQAEYNACVDQLSVLKVTSEEAKRQKKLAEEELKKLQSRTLQLEQLWTQMSEKDRKIVSLDNQLSEARVCLERMNQKLHEKIDALSAVSDREKKLMKESESLICSVRDLEGAIEQADQKIHFLESKKQWTENELSTVLSQIDLLQSKLQKYEETQKAALSDAESLRNSERALAESNKNLRVELELADTKLAASGMSYLSKAATIEELRSVLATNELASSCTTAEMKTSHLKHDDALAKVAELEALNTKMREENEHLITELMSIKTSSSVSESAKAEIEEKMAFVEHALIDTRKQLASSQSQALEFGEEIMILRNELSRKGEALPMTTVDTAEQTKAMSDEREKKLIAVKAEVINSRSLVSRASRDIAHLKDRHINEMKRVKSEFAAERMALEQSHELVVERFKGEVEEAYRLSKTFKEECATAKGKLAELDETVQLQAQELHDERLHFKKERQVLVSRVQHLERERSALDSGRRRSLEQLSYLSEELSREKENVSALKRSRDLARNDARKVRNDNENMQKVHLEDIEQMLNELDSKTREEAAAVLAKKISDEFENEVNDLVTSLARSQKDAENLRCTLESTRQDYQERINRLLTQKAELEQEMKNRLCEKEEEIVSSANRLQEVQSRLDDMETELAEARVERRALETKKTQAESRAADATSESERLSRRLNGMEDDLSAMANEIEMMIVINEQLEQRLIEMKAARATAEDEFERSCEVASMHETLIAELKAKIEEIGKENQLLRQEVETLKGGAYDLLMEKEHIEAEKKKIVQSLHETSVALEASRETVKEKYTESILLREQLSEISEKLFTSNQELEGHKDIVAKLTGELEKIRHESEVKFEQQKLRIEEVESNSIALEKTIDHLQKDIEEKDATLSCQREDLSRLKHDLESRTKELVTTESEKIRAVLKVNELKKRLESAKSLLEESKVSQEMAAKLEVSNRTLINRVNELEAVHNETMNDLNEAETSLALSVHLSNELKQQVDASQTDINRFKTQVQVLESTITRMRSGRLLQEETTKKLQGELARAAEVKIDRAVSSLKEDSDSKARGLIELAAKLTARSKLIAQSKLYEQTLISFIEKLMERIESLLDTVSSQSLILKTIARGRGKMGISMESLDLALPRTPRHANSSCDGLLLIVSSAKKDFEGFKQELQLLKRGAVSEDSNPRLLTPPSSPKYTTLSSNLSKIKTMLPADERDDRSSSPREKSLRELVDYMELQIDGLIADLFASRRALESKEEALSELEDLLSLRESEKETTAKNLKSMQVYIKEMEGKLAEESFRETADESQRSLDLTKKAAMKTAAARAICNMLQRGSNASAGQALRKWSNNACAMKAVDQQRFVAEALARQLEITREKVAILKSHVKHSHSATGRRDAKDCRFP